MQHVNFTNELFESAFNHAAIGMALVSATGDFLKVNSALCRILGYAETDLLATNFQSITHAEDLASDLGFVTMMLEKSISHYEMQKRYMHKSGATIHALLSVSLVWNANGSPRFFISQIQDITARVQAETALRKTKEELEKALSEVKELRGILPICSYCKRIRSDNAYSQSLEAYVSTHSHLRLSHGICPECLPKVKSDFAEEFKKLEANP